MRDGRKKLEEAALTSSVLADETNEANLRRNTQVNFREISPPADPDVGDLQSLPLYFGLVGRTNLSKARYFPSRHGHLMTLGPTRRQIDGLRSRGEPIPAPLLRGMVHHPSVATLSARVTISRTIPNRRPH